VDVLASAERIEHRNRYCSGRGDFNIAPAKNLVVAREGMANSSGRVCEVVVLYVPLLGRDRCRRLTP